MKYSPFLIKNVTIHSKITKTPHIFQIPTNQRGQLVWQIDPQYLKGPELSKSSSYLFKIRQQKINKNESIFTIILTSKRKKIFLDKWKIKCFNYILIVWIIKISYYCIMNYYYNAKIVNIKKSPSFYRQTKYRWAKQVSK